ncbi:P-loop containing nucleoside triphosphate hydrolase protein [Mycena rebaudengoi]|nr:P-loop containing nucleoside triphosphate hydrolase protein [Mycena rebaudengoi]
MHRYFSQDFGQRHVFLLHGLGGSGKTQIALRFLEETDTSRFTHNFFLDASSIETLKSGLANISVTQSIGRDHQDALLWLAHQAEWLLIFDNADDPNINLYHFFPQSNCGNILITSRNPQLSIHAPDTHQHVSNMDVEDAVQLLLASSVQPTRPANQILATEIVKVLHCFPLAVVQAGAFISKTGDMGKYLSRYKLNQARLLSTMPAQSHDKYAWSVYTTWDISFQRLSNLAVRFLQLCSFLHHDGITESMFSNAAAYLPCVLGPTKEEIKEARMFLANFMSDSGEWDTFAFVEMTAEIQGYSLISKDPNTDQFSIHPLVHDWSRNTVTEIDTIRECTAAILAMSVVDNQVFANRLRPHLDILSLGIPLLANKFPLPFGHVYYASGSFHRAMELQRVVLEKSQNILGPHHPDTLTAMANLAVTYHHLEKFTDAEVLQATVVETCKHNLGTDHPRTLHAMSTLALTYGDLGKFLDAEQLLVVVLKKSREILGINHPDTLHAMTNLAVTFKGLGKLTDAEELEIEVLSKRKEILGADDRETLLTMGNLAITYRALERYKDAEELEIVVLEKRKQILGEDHPHTLSAMLSLAATYRKLRKFEDAEKLLAVVLEKRTQILGRDHPRTFDAMASLATTYRNLGKFDLAKDLEILVLENHNQSLGEEHPRTLNAMANLGATYRSLGRLREAEHLEKIVLEKRRQLLGPSHADTLRAMETLDITA